MDGKRSKQRSDTIELTGFARRAAGRATVVCLLLGSAVSAIYMGVYYHRWRLFRGLVTVAPEDKLVLWEVGRSEVIQSVYWVGGTGLLLVLLVAAFLLVTRLPQLLRLRTFIGALAVLPLLVPVFYMQMQVDALVEWASDDFQEQWFFPLTYNDKSTRSQLPRITSLDGATASVQARTSLRWFPGERSLNGKPIDGRVEAGQLPALHLLLKTEADAAREMALLFEGIEDAQFDGRVNVLADWQTTWATLKPILRTLEGSEFRTVDWVVSHPQQEASLEVSLIPAQDKEAVSPHILFMETGWRVVLGPEVAEVEMLSELPTLIKDHAEVSLRPEDTVSLQQMVEVIRVVKGAEHAPRVVLEL